MAGPGCTKMKFGPAKSQRFKLYTFWSMVARLVCHASSASAETWRTGHTSKRSVAQRPMVWPGASCQGAFGRNRWWIWHGSAAGIHLMGPWWKHRHFFMRITVVRVTFQNFVLLRWSEAFQVRCLKAWFCSTTPMDFSRSCSTLTLQMMKGSLMQ